MASTDGSDTHSDNEQKASLKIPTPLVSQAVSNNVVNLKFQVRFKTVKSKPLRLCVVGSLPELGQADIKHIRSPKVYMRLEKKLQSTFKFHQSKLPKENFPLTTWGDSPETLQFETYFESRLTAMELVEDETHLENMWSTQSIRIRADAGTKFTYIYMVWNMEDKTVWECPAKAGLRTREVPSMKKCESFDPRGNVVHEYIFRDNTISNLVGDEEGKASRFALLDEDDMSDYDM